MIGPFAPLFADLMRRDSASAAEKPWTATQIGWCLAGTAVLFGVWWGWSWLAARRALHRPYRSRWRLFLSLCRAHQLKWSDRGLLWKLARSQSLAEPGRLFLESERFEPKRLGASFAKDAPRLAALRSQLFEPLTRAGSEKPAEKPAEERLAAKPVAAQFPLPPTPVLDIPPWNAQEV